jgi:CBS domain-containing protein
MGRRANLPDRERGETPVRDVMRRDFVTVTVDEPLAEALRIMRFARLRHLLVEADGVLVGVLSYRDLLDRIVDAWQHGAPQLAPSSVPVEQAMARATWAVTPDTRLREAAARLCNLRVGCLPVVDGRGARARLIGIVTEADLLRAAFAGGEAAPGDTMRRRGRARRPDPA